MSPIFGYLALPLLSITLKANTAPISLIDIFDISGMHGMWLFVKVLFTMAVRKNNRKGWP